MPTSHECAYLAGILDGEGSVYILSITRAKKATQHALCIHVVNTHKGVMDWIVETFGGRLYSRKPRIKKLGFPERRVQHTWRQDGYKALAVLKLLLPYMIIKKEQAIVGIDLQERIMSFGGNQWYRLTPEELEWRILQKQRISDLNQHRESAD